MTENAIEKFFDTLAPDWKNSEADYPKRQRIMRLAGLKSNCAIADIGCGQGVMFSHLLETEPKAIYGIDLSSKMLERARQSFSDKRIFLLHGDLLDLDLPPLDAAVIYNAYPHFLNKSALCDKLHKSIKKDGMLIIAHSTGKSSINGRHSGSRVSEVSVPLESAELEALKFSEHFFADTLIDEEELYFIKLIRK